MHDFLYAGNGEYFYRLAIGTDAYLDFVFPPAGLPGSNDNYTLYGRNLPGGQPTDLVVGRRQAAGIAAACRLPLPADAERRAARFQRGRSSRTNRPSMALPIAWRRPRAVNSVLIGYATAPVVREQEPNDEPAQAQAVTRAVRVRRAVSSAGRSRLGHDSRPKPGEVLWMEVFSQRLGLPTDPYLLVQQVTKNDKGEEQVKEIAGGRRLSGQPAGPGAPRHGDLRHEDRRSGVSLRRAGRRHLSRAGPQPGQLHARRSAARLSAGDSPEQPDFRLVAKPRLLPFSTDPNQNPPTVWSPLLRKGGTELIDVVVFRRDGFNGGRGLGRRACRRASLRRRSRSGPARKSASWC